MVGSFGSLRKICWHSALLDDRRNSYHRAKAPSYAGRLLYISILFLAPLAALREILGLACPAALGPSSWSAAQLRAERLEFAPKYAPLSSGLFDRHFHRFNGRRELLPDFSVDLISNILGEQLRAGVNKR